MRIVLMSDFKIKTGYFTLAEAIALELVAIGHDVTVLGLGYDQRVEHLYPFGLHPTITEFGPQQLIKLDDLFNYDWVLLLMDVPKQLNVLRNIQKNKMGWLRDKKIVSLFPVESDPFYIGWAEDLKRLTKLRCTFTEFGKAKCAEAGLPIHVLPYGPSKFWSEDIEAELPDQPYVLTVAANQTRKNIPTAMAIVRKSMEKHEDLLHLIVTDIDSKDGWDLAYMGGRMGFKKDTLVLIDRSAVTNVALRHMYRRAKAFLITSISEGIGIPIYEAQSQGCPALAVNCCGNPEAVRSTDRLIDIAFKSPQPWGNTTHYWASVEDGVAKLDRVLSSSHRVDVKYPAQESMARKLNTVLNAFDTMIEAAHVTR